MGVYALEIMLAGGIEICGVVTRSDDPSPGMWYKSVTELAQRNGLAVFKPTHINSPEFVGVAKDLSPDFRFRRGTVPTGSIVAS